MSDVVLVRHGETEWSRAGRHTSRTDVPLTEAGRSDTRKVREFLAGRSFARVLTSPSRRAVDTCSIAGFGASAQPRDGMMEWGYGEYEGRTTNDIRAERPGWTQWDDGCPGGETADDVGARADRIIAEVREIDGNVLIFGHSH